MTCYIQRRPAILRDGKSAIPNCGVVFSWAWYLNSNSVALHVHVPSLYLMSISPSYIHIPILILTFPSHIYVSSLYSISLLMSMSLPCIQDFTLYQRFSFISTSSPYTFITSSCVMSFPHTRVFLSYIFLFLNQVSPLCLCANFYAQVLPSFRRFSPMFTSAFILMSAYNRTFFGKYKSEIEIMNIPKPHTLEASGA